ncbi:DUF241 domain protein [Gossypium australe]|uniref:DUF241 domain protein n=1 Tax=Gossypium australe TaxID=47621 RepID=A0A5B6UZM0_9ROSI|nr:DUF241 domain protein [Gossypium australe]
MNKSLRDLKIKPDLENDAEATLNMLREVEGVTLTINGAMMQPKSFNWSLFSKQMHSKPVTCEGEATDTNEFEKVNAVLSTLIDYKARTCNNMSTENAQIELE